MKTIVIALLIHSVAFGASAAQLQCYALSKTICKSDPILENPENAKTICAVNVQYQYDNGTSQIQTLVGEGYAYNSAVNLFDVLTGGLTKAGETVYNYNAAKKKAKKELQLQLDKLSFYPKCK